MSEMDPDFFSDPAVIGDPKPYFDALRAKCPVAREAHHGAVMVTGYASVMDILGRKDDVFSSVVAVLGPIPPLPFEPHGDDISAQLEAHRAQIPWSAHLSSFDGKRHIEHRTILTSLLSFTRIRQNETYLRGLTDKLLDGIVRKALAT